jgi:expansin (peptidoglycan-binding protein)
MERFGADKEAFQYGNTGVPSSHCGQTVTITNTNTGATVVATVADACPSCQGNPNSLDLSVGAFQALGDLSLGMSEY